MLKISKSMKRWFAWLFLPGIYIVVMFLMQKNALSRHTQSLLVPLCINIILALSLNIVVGMLGELSLGHAGFMSIGAYTGSLFSLLTLGYLPTMIRYPLAILFGSIMAGFFAGILSIPVFRLKGDYLAIVTLGFGEIIRSLIINFAWTGGAAGLKGTPRDTTFTTAYLLTVLVWIISQKIYYSKQGLEMRAVRDNAIAAEACGIDVIRRKRTGFIMAAAIAGSAGVLYSHYYTILTAGVFDYNRSIEILVMVVLGGMGSMAGSVLSAVALTVVPEALRFLNDYRMLIYSLLLIAAMLGRQSSILNQWKQRMKEVRESHGAIE
jgi:branched-chain amino acid transport system permease protein